jgi:uncharacterized membrane protein
MGKNKRWLILVCCAALSGCGANTARMFRAVETYHALGHEPGWLLTMEKSKLKFVTSRPYSVLEGPRPLAQISAIGRRYSTDRVTLDIFAQPCSDTRSGIAFSDTVIVTANGNTYRGCGGERVQLLDR